MLLARFGWFCSLLLRIVPVTRRLPKVCAIASTESKQRSKV
jgi:hypothetical protein